MFGFLKRKKPVQPIVVNCQDNEYLTDFIYKWNIKFPLDYWYRKHHNIAFNSNEHREVSFFDIRMEYEEWHLFEELKSRQMYKKGDWINTRTEEESMTQEEKLVAYRKEFDNLDLSQYQD